MSMVQRVNVLLRRHAIEPARWSMASTISTDVPLKLLGVKPHAALSSYARAAERTGFRAKVAALVSHAGGFYWSPCPVRTSRVASKRLSPSTVVTLLCGASTLAIDPDSGAFVMVEWKTSAVASFLFDDVVDTDPRPGDFAFEATSLERWCAALGNPKHRPPWNTTARELSRRYRRGIWVSHCVGSSAPIPPDLERVEHTARDASPFAVYLRERRSFAVRPHDALYWLLTFALVSADGPLADALERSRDVTHPAVVDLRRRLVRGENLIAHHRHWKATERRAVFDAIRVRVTQQVTARA